MKSIIIRGAKGFLGSALKRIALEKGYIVYDSREDELPSDLSECVVYNFGWHGTSGEIRGDANVQIDNIRDNLSFLEFVSKRGCTKFVNAGSIMEYEVMSTIPNDGNRPGINSYYSISKLTADLMLKTFSASNGIDYYNVVISNIYGPGEKSQRFLNSVMRMMLKNETIKLTACEQKYDFIYIDDAVRAIMFAAENGNPFENFYIGNSEQRRLKDYVLDMRDAIGSRSELLFGAVPYYGNDLAYEMIDCSKLEKMGFEMRVGFCEGVMRLYDWMKKEGQDE